MVKFVLSIENLIYLSNVKVFGRQSDSEFYKTCVFSCIFLLWALDYLLWLLEGWRLDGILFPGTKSLGGRKDLTIVKKRKEQVHRVYCPLFRTQETRTLMWVLYPSPSGSWKQRTSGIFSLEKKYR